MMRLYEIKFKKGRKKMTWERYGTHIVEARLQAIKALEDEYYGEAKFIGIKEI